MDLTRREALALSAGVLAACEHAEATASIAAEQTLRRGNRRIHRRRQCRRWRRRDRRARDRGERQHSADRSQRPRARRRSSCLLTAIREPGVATFHFGKLSASSASASTRIRLAQTQNIVAVAKLKDGSFAKATRPVKVTIGGCGG